MQRGKNDAHGTRVQIARTLILTGGLARLFRKDRRANAVFAAAVALPVASESKQLERVQAALRVWNDSGQQRLVSC